MASIYGKNIRISIFGQSHSEAIGVVIDGLPAGFRIDIERLQFFLNRRAPGKNNFSSQRAEPDVPEFISGLVDGVTCGAPLCAVIRNMDAKSVEYDDFQNIPRPGHADFTAMVKFGGHNDSRGGGHFSGRLTAPLCVAGGICMQFLERDGIGIGAHVADIAGVEDIPFDPVAVNFELLESLKQASFPVIDDRRGKEMLKAVATAQSGGDSVGGIIECAAVGVPAGLGDPMFDGVENRIASIVFGIPAVCGIEFGNGFNSAFLRGSVNNDAFYMDGKSVKVRTNRHGGVLGGITSGMPIVFRAAIKPTPSIAHQQESVVLSRSSNSEQISGRNTSLSINGRHDPCIVPRAVPCIEAAAAIAIFDMMIK